jgi:multiple sugar transport system substrate-binding protein
VTGFIGLTWDHPRGREALEAAAARVDGGDTLRWEVQPLEGFESAPIDELAARYDLLVLDHPHLGDALATESLTPVDELFPPTQVAAWEHAAVGPSVASYRMDGHLWALPLDAATQVSARDPRLVPDAPRTWDEALALADRGLVATSLAGPHAFLSLCSIAVSLHDSPGGAASDAPGAASGRLFDPALGAAALDLLTRLSAHAPTGTAELNPIGLLDRMRDLGDIGCVPLVYGYVTYSGPHLVFDAPPGGVGGRLGSTIGGTGIAVTRRCAPSPALLAHLAWLMDPATQCGFVPAHAGQPSAAAAWDDPAVDAAASGFYSRTRPAIDAAWVRPRLRGYIPFQSDASALVRDAVAGRRDAAEVLAELERRFAALVAASADGAASTDPSAAVAADLQESA